MDTSSQSRVHVADAPVSISTSTSDSVGAGRALRVEQVVPTGNAQFDGGENELGLWSLPDGDITQLMDSAYAEVIKWKRNTFNVPFGDDGGHFVAELARLICLFSNGSEARAFAWSAVVGAGHLLLQHPFSTSSAADNKEFLCKCLTL